MGLVLDSCLITLLSVLKSGVKLNTVCRANVALRWTPSCQMFTLQIEIQNMRGTVVHK